MSEIIEKENFSQREKQISKFVTEMPAQDYNSDSKTVDPIVQALKGNSKLSTIEKLVKSSGCTLVKPYGFILENSGKVVTISQVINFFGLNTTNSVRCPHQNCDKILTWDVILYHLEQNYDSGHDMKPTEVTDLFSRRWYNWEYRNGSFWERGEKIEKTW